MLSTAPIFLCLDMSRKKQRTTNLINHKYKKRKIRKLWLVTGRIDKMYTCVIQIAPSNENIEPQMCPVSRLIVLPAKHDPNVYNLRRC